MKFSEFITREQLNEGIGDWLYSKFVTKPKIKQIQRYAAALVDIYAKQDIAILSYYYNLLAVTIGKSGPALGKYLESIGADMSTFSKVAVFGVPKFMFTRELKDFKDPLGTFKKFIEDNLAGGTKVRTEWTGPGNHPVEADLTFKFAVEGNWKTGTPAMEDNIESIVKSNFQTKNTLGVATLEKLARALDYPREKEWSRGIANPKYGNMVRCSLDGDILNCEIKLECWSDHIYHGATGPMVQ